MYLKIALVSSIAVIAYNAGLIAQHRKTKKVIPKVSKGIIDAMIDTASRTLDVEDFNRFADELVKIDVNEFAKNYM